MGSGNEVPRADIETGELFVGAEAIAKAKAAGVEVVEFDQATYIDLANRDIKDRLRRLDELKLIPHLTKAERKRRARAISRIGPNC